MSLLRERAVEAWGDGSREPREASSAEPEPTDADALDELADEVARLAAHLHAAKSRLLALVAEFDRCGGWKAGGHRSCAHWLAFRAGLDMSTARTRGSR